MIIEHAVTNDLEEILALQKLAYQENAVRYNDFEIPPMKQTLSELVKETKSGIMLKAVCENKIVGSVRAREQGGNVYIGRLIVHPDYQNQGIGRKLMNAVEREFNAFVYKLFTGHSDEKNLSFYSKRGYTVYKEEKISPFLSFIHMEKKPFLIEDEYVDFNAPHIQAKAAELFNDSMDDIEKARAAYEFVRDKIPHSFDCGAKIITAKASDVLKHETGICHAKSNLLAALLRSQGIPAGFCFQHCTLADDDALGYCVHCYNAIYVNNRWVKADARGNKPGVNAQFSLDVPVLAFPPRPEYDEYLWPGIYAAPHEETMQMLEKAGSLDYIIKNIPEMITLPPDIKE